MEVILQEKIYRLGDLGDKVSVKAGFARNFLIPQGKAVPATGENLAAFEVKRAELEARAAEALTEAEKRKAVLTNVSVSIAVRSGEEGKLYGSVGVREVADAMSAQGIEVEKRELSLPEGPIRTLGEHKVHIQLHSDVNIEILVQVIPE